MLWWISCKTNAITPIKIHSGPVMPYGDKDLGQHWLRWWHVAWWHQAITWTNVDWSSVNSSAIHIWAILQEMPQPSITKIHLKITYLKFHSKIPRGQWVKKIKSPIQINKIHHFNDNQQTHSSKAILDNIKGIGGPYFAVLRSDCSMLQHQTVHISWKKADQCQTEVVT